MTPLTSTVNEKTTLRDFAVTCGTWFRGIESDPETGSWRVSTRGEWAAEASVLKGELARIEAMSDAEINEEQRRVEDAERARDLKFRWEAELRATMYRKLLAQVEDWNPPTPDHLRLKELMRQQLVESIAVDGPGEADAVHRSGVVVALCSGKANRPWRARKVADLKEEIAEYERRDKAEIERVQEIANWMQALTNSL